MINVTKPFLPNRDTYNNYLNGIWNRVWLTNNGPLVNELELKLKEYLDLPHLLFLGNGTIAIQIAIKALELKGEIITTPFSYVATTNSIIWEGCKPVFVDIDRHSLNIDPNRIEEAITSETSAILATHVYGNPCDIDSIQRIAEKHNLKVIYDAAHCFGTKYKGKSVFAYGDISTASFHSTKIFHTIEGGAVFSQNPALIKQMSYIRNFGHNGPEDFECVGINGKNSEFHAAMGLCILPHMDEILKKRSDLCERYSLRLRSFLGERPVVSKDAKANNAYYPLVFKSEESLKLSMRELEANKIMCRRYFFPSLNSLKYLEKNVSCEVSEDTSRRVLCLPLFHDLTFEEVDFICRILLRVQNN